MNSYIIKSSDPISNFQTHGGGKALNLAKLSQAGFQVPEWFCVSVNAYDLFLKNAKLQIQPEKDLIAFSKKIEELFLKTELPKEVEEAILSSIKALNLEDAFLAVRSSGLDEDSAQNSFAGQFSSYLFQKGRNSIIESLKKCWASGYSERALSYRIERGLSLEGIRVGVVIQRMVSARQAGVVFSRHPIKVLERDLVLISSVWGLGEGLVSGELESDNFESNRKSKEISKQLVKKSHQLLQAPEGGLIKTSVPDGEQEISSLSDQEINEIASLSVKLEDHFGKPQDSEWVIEKGKLYLVQTRPITNLPPNAFFDEKVNGKEAILWDNSNIIESYGGVTTPLTFSFASRAYYQVYVQFCEIMGVPNPLIEKMHPVFRNMLGLIRGRIYYNLIHWYKLVLLLPGSGNNKTFMETMMGVKDQLKPELGTLFDFAKNPQSYSFFHKLKLIGVTFWRFNTIDSIVSKFQRHFNSVYEPARKQDCKNLSLTELMTHYQTLEDQVLKKWHAPIINDYLCMLFFGLLKKLTEKWIPLEAGNASIQNDLLCGQGELESTEPTKFLMRMADKIDNGDATFRNWFITEDPNKIWETFKNGGGNKEIRELLFTFLDRYGFRCINELKLEEPDLHDDPAFVIHSLVSYVKTKSYNVKEMERKEQEIKKAAEQKILDVLPLHRRLFYDWVLKHARKAVKNRENLRFARTKIFGVARHIFRGMGHQMHRMEILNHPHDIFYLTLEEIQAFVEGRGSTLDVMALTQSRKREFVKYDKTPAPPDRFLTYGAVGSSLPYVSILTEADLLRKKMSENQDPNVLVGTPCCPGVVEGVVRVVTGMQDALGLQGEILVTERTDPGWVPLYPSCSGLLIERGSLLSHSAVVARELGLPTIVGISGGLMKKLKTGQRVRVDAGKGEVRILS